MVKHNNPIPNVHFHKWWQRYVKTWFDQPGKKKARRIARQRKVAKLGSRPVGLLRPLVHPPTQRYNMKLRKGKGFTFEEMRAAGVSPKVGRTIGIAVDHRRRNRCVESLNLNTARIKAYLAKLVVFPRRCNKAKKGNAGIPDDTLRSKVENVKQTKILQAFPVVQPKRDVTPRAITPEEREFKAYYTLRKLRKEERVMNKKKKEEEGVAV